MGLEIIDTLTFQTRGAVPPHLFVDREKELGDILAGIARGESYLVHGPRRCGKSSFLIQIADIIGKQNADTFMVKFSYHIKGEDSLKDFLRLFCLQVILTIWKEIFKKDIMELTNTVKRLLNFSWRFDERHKKVIRFHRLVKRAKTQIGKRKISFWEMMLSLIAKGPINEEVTEELIPPEEDEIFCALGEVINSVLPEFNRILVFVEDISVPPTAFCAQKIKRLLELLSELKFQFIFTGSQDNNDLHFNSVPECSRTLRLSEFEDSEYVKQIIRLTIDNFEKMDRQIISLSDMEIKKVPLEFDENCADKIFELSQGIPYKIQELCDSSCRYSLNRGEQIVKLCDVNAAYTELLPTWTRNDTANNTLN